MNAVIKHVAAMHAKAANRKIVCTSCCYGAIRSVLQYVEDSYSIEIIVVETEYPISDDEYVARVKRALDDCVILAVFDHITSVPGVIVPIQRLINLCHAFNIPVAVDAAHAIGQVAVDIGALKPDFYVGNLHKWFHCPRGCAILYSCIEVHPTVVSFGYKKGLQEEFSYVGTSNDVNYYCLDKVLEFREWYLVMPTSRCGGDDSIMKYTHDLAVTGGELVASIWKTKVLVGLDNFEIQGTRGYNLIPSMVNVLLPDTENTRDDEFMSGFMIKLLKERRVSAAFYKHGMKWWVRLSAQVFNASIDFEKFATIVLEEI